jgi:hypothetical protein
MRDFLDFLGYIALPTAGSGRMGLPVRLFLLVVLFVSPVHAAPTCQNLQGETMRCGTVGAMPVGWRLHGARQPPTKADEASLSKVLEAVCLLGVFFSLMALMPDFEGSGVSDWDAEEDETKRRR